MKNERQENLVRRYLLGDLSEAEQTALEQEYFADSEKFEQIWALENELVDGYVRGQLRDQERTLFERHYLTTPNHRQRVAIARTLVQTADATIVAEVAEKKDRAIEPTPIASWWSNLLAWTPQLAWGGAAALLLLALGGWWYLRSTAPTEQIAQQPTSSPAPSVVAPAPQSSALPSTPDSPGQASPTPLPQSSVQSAVAPVFAVILAGSLRNAGDLQQVVIPRGTKQMWLEMKLEGDDYPTYQIKLRRLGGAETLSQAKPAADKKSVVANLPASQLAAGDYTVTLSGVNRAGEVEEVNRYYLRVSQK
jgi:hypothetical protein